MTDNKPSWLSVPVAILIGALLIAGSVLYIGSDDTTATISDQTGDPSPTPIEDYESLVSDTDPVLGNADAPVTIVEFSDFQCPYCRSFWLSTFSQLKADYIDTGKVKLVFRDVPLSFHDAAGPSAIGGQCALEQGKFWEYHDELFAQQMQLEADPTQVASTVTYGITEIKAWARLAGVNGTAFDACLDAETYTDRIQEDISAATEVGVDGTPSFFINGEPLVGAQPYVVFQAAIDRALE
ncbi:MAG TPA: DsbA family protein [Candidatus Paceibacterota bacterium]|nr:DsbA family protein [Candidatus Paceibacterota bacterium]